MPARPVFRRQRPWSKGLLIGQKKPVEPKYGWSIRVRLEIARSRRELAILTSQSTASFALAIWSNCAWTTFVQEQKCDIGQRSSKRRLVDQSNSRSRSSRRIPSKRGYHRSGPPVLDTSFQVGFTRALTYQLGNMVHRWVESIGLERAVYGTHSMRRTKAAQIYRKTGNLRAVQLLLSHTKLESTVRYLGIEVDDALNIAEQIDL